MITSRDFSNTAEPNWLFVQNHSHLEYNDQEHIFVAFMDRYAYKAADSQWDCWDEHDENALSEGYFLDWMTEAQYTNMCDPWFGQDPVVQGPYFPDQGEHGDFKFHGPKPKFHGPRTGEGFKPPGYPHRYFWDQSLRYIEDNPVANYY